MRLHPSVSVVLLACGLSARAEPPSSAETDACIKAYSAEVWMKTQLTLVEWKEACGAGLTPEQIIEAALNLLPSHAAAQSATAAPAATAKFAALDKAVTGLGAVTQQQGPAALYGETQGAPDAVSSLHNPGTVKFAPFDLEAPSPATPSINATGVPQPYYDLPEVAPKAAGGGPSWFRRLAAAVESRRMPYGRALSAYLDMTGLQHYGAKGVGSKNSGLSRFYASLAENDRGFETKLRDFYARVAKVDSEHDNPMRRPNLGQAAGRGRHDRLEPGWAWKEALSAADGDPNTAMRLIGYCGHDNTERGEFVRRFTPEEAERRMAEHRKMLEDRIAARHARGGLNAGTLIADDQRRISNLTAEEFRTEPGDNPCPFSGSYFYLPGSLDVEADIPDELKGKVALSEYKGETRLARISAKHYHVLGAAAAACELIRNGAPPWLAVLIQTNAGRAYRTMRSHEDALGPIIARKAIADAYASYKKGLESGAEPMDSTAFRHRWNLDNGKRLHAADFEEMDAYELMLRRGYGVTLSDEFYPVNVRMNPLKTAMTRGRPRGWTKDRYEKALARMKGAFVEQEWTVAQHESGSRFAAKVCKEVPETAP